MGWLSWGFDGGGRQAFPMFRLDNGPGVDDSRLTMKPFTTTMRTAAVAAVTVLGLGLGAGAAAAQPALPEFPMPAPAPGAPAPAPAPGVDIPGLPGIAAPAAGGAKEIVAFGDSFTANAGKGGPRGLEAGQTPWVANCATDMENWPKIAAKELGKSIGDWSCNGTGGAPLVQMKAYLESAIAYGDIGPGTQDVVLMYGGMDALQWVDVAGEFTGQPVPNETLFRNLVKDIRDRVAQAAPGARVTLLSYPEYATDDKLCLVNVGGTVNPIPAPGGTKVQEAFRDNIKHAAEANGLNFIDVYEATIGHGSCNPNPNDRWVVGFQDPEMGPMPNHPTVKGEIAMGKIVANGLR